MGEAGNQEEPHTRWQAEADLFAEGYEAAMAKHRPMADLVIREHDDGRVEILEAPTETLISLQLLCRHVMAVDGDVIGFNGQVDYRVIGWDAAAAALLVRLVEDRRTTW